jgi:ribosomal RNA-processing protein 1
MAVEHDADAQQQREIKFGRRLAANEKRTRDKAVKKLKSWLSRQHSLTVLDNRKIWRGLFYAMWMSDKPLVQEELADELVCFLILPRVPGTTGL